MNMVSKNILLVVLLGSVSANAAWYKWNKDTTGSVVTSSPNWILQDNTDRTGYWVLEGTENKYTGDSYSAFNGITIENATFTHASTSTNSGANIAGLTVNAGGVLNCMRIVTGGSTQTIHINAGGSVVTSTASSYLGDNAKTTMYLNGGSIEFKGNTVLAQHNIGWYSIKNGGEMKGTTLSLGGSNDNKFTGSRCDVYIGSLSDSSNAGNISASNLSVGSANPGTLSLYRGSVSAPTLNIGGGYKNNGDVRATTGTGDLVNYFGTVTATTMGVGKANNDITGRLTLAAEGGVVSVQNLTINTLGTVDFQVTSQGVGKLALTGSSLTNNGTVQLSSGSTLAVTKPNYTIYEGTPALNVTDHNTLWNVGTQADNKIDIALDPSGKVGDYTINSGWIAMDDKASGWLNLTGIGGDPIEMMFTTDLTTETEVATFVATLLEDNTLKATVGSEETEDILAPNLWAEGTSIHLLMDPLTSNNAFTWDFAGYGNTLTGFSAVHVPEPGAFWLLLLGVAGLWRRRS